MTNTVDKLHVKQYVIPALTAVTGAGLTALYYEYKANTCHERVTYIEKPFIVDKPYEVEKTIFIDKPYAVEHTIYVDKPIEVEKTIYVDKITEIPCPLVVPVICPDPYGGL